MKRWIPSAAVGLLAGPVLFAAVLLLPLPDGMTPAGLHVAAVAVLMAVWWISGAIPIPATALLPIVLFPLLGVMSGGKVTQAYAHHLIYLFLGGFLIAVTMEKWHLHRRIALYTVRLVGLTPSRIVLGFMLATAMLSMWISNTAATMLMVTIGIAVLHELSDSGRHGSAALPLPPGQVHFGTVLMLAIAYAASIGGIATLIGTPPNAILAGVIERNYGYQLGFFEWMKFGLPFSTIALVLVWLYLTRVFLRGQSIDLPGGYAVIAGQISQLGPMTREEKYVGTVLAGVAVLWILRGLVDAETLPMVRDSTIAMAGALVLFLIPVNIRKREFLLDWKTAVTIPWDVIILFGGGFALAQGFSDSGLTTWLAGRLSVLAGLDVVLIVAAVTALVIFLTEITSNTATAALLLPVTGALAAGVGVQPLGLMTVVVVAASCAFMLPVATPPNAIAFSSRYITIPQMMQAGFRLNLAGVLLITGFVYYVLPAVWGLELVPVTR